MKLKNTLSGPEFCSGLKDGIPIAMGYFAVSFSFGVLARKGGLLPMVAGLISLSNVTSAGQFAGLEIIIAGGSILVMILTQFIINLRYALMSLSLSQKLPDNIGFAKRLIIAFANTDEIFAVAMARKKTLSFRYMVGLELLPVLSWTFGTICGAVASDLLPKSIQIALGLALYGMFVAIVLPVAKKEKNVLFAVVMAMLISMILFYVPVFKCLPSGMPIVIATVLSSFLAAVVYPVENDTEPSGDASSGQKTSLSENASSGISSSDNNTKEEA
ncbi:MAG: AzlC family ABC transporter permease [Clostridiales bacterium]|nr:AzlC family ABC transporter permease [Clostridiales bacterium]